MNKTSSTTALHIFIVHQCAPPVAQRFSSIKLRKYFIGNEAVC